MKNLLFAIAFLTALNASSQIYKVGYLEKDTVDLNDVIKVGLIPGSGVGNYFSTIVLTSIKTGATFNYTLWQGLASSQPTAVINGTVMNIVSVTIPNNTSIYNQGSRHNIIFSYDLGPSMDLIIRGKYSTVGVPELNKPHNETKLYFDILGLPTELTPNKLITEITVTPYGILSRKIIISD